MTDFLDDYERIVNDAENKIDALQAENRRLAKDVESLRAGDARYEHDLLQVLGRALGYPRYADDPKNFPDATDADGVCTGDHVSITLAQEATAEIAKFKGAYDRQALVKENARLHEEVEALTRSDAAYEHDLRQLLGGALGYPRTVPDGSESHDVRVPDNHTGLTLAEEAAHEIESLRAGYDRLAVDYRMLVESFREEKLRNDDLMGKLHRATAEAADDSPGKPYGEPP